MSKRWLVVLCVAMAALSVMQMASAAPDGTDRPFKASFAGPVHWEFPGGIRIRVYRDHDRDRVARQGDSHGQGHVVLVSLPR